MVYGARKYWSYCVFKHATVLHKTKAEHCMMLPFLHKNHYMFVIS